MASNYFNEYTGLTTLQWWMGQVVDEKNWSGNENDKIHKRDDIAGWGKRYKVRIFGRDSKTKDTTDDQLEMAEILYPVTAGSGHAGAVQTANIRQGAYVVGFYKDGVDATEPIIMGVLGNNSQTRLYGGDPTDGFVARSGYKGVNGDKQVSPKNMYAEGPSSIFFDESINLHSWAVHLVDQVKDASHCEFIPKTRKCEGAGGETKKMQSAIKNLLAEVNRIKAEAEGFLGAASKLSSSIEKILKKAVNLVSQAAKVTIDNARGYVVNKLNAGVSDLINLLPPNQRSNASDKAENAIDTLQCIFNSIIKGLSALVEKLLRQLIDQYINAPLCAIEKFLADLLGAILGQITSAIDAALSIMNAVFGAAINIVGNVLDVLSNVFGVFDFLPCSENAACTTGDQWSFWNGANCALDAVSPDLSSITTGLIQNKTNPSCNTAQSLCNSPIISIPGALGQNALANPIISSAGSIIGLDIIRGGFGYISTPNVVITQNCNNGGGAVIVPILGSTTSATGIGTTGGSVVGAVVVDPGTGYLRAPNGSTGGNGITFSEPCDTILKTNANGYQAAKKPGTVVSVVVGDTVYLPQSTVVKIYNSIGEEVQTLNGLGQLTPITINSAGTFTAPDCVSTATTATSFPVIPSPTTPANTVTYPVVLSMCEMEILDPGVNYNNTDKVIISPSNGATAEIKVNDAGAVEKISVTNCGVGYTDIPNIYIQSETGINATFSPKFTIIKGQDLATVPPGTELIHVVNCVGSIV